MAAIDPAAAQLLSAHPPTISTVHIEAPDDDSVPRKSENTSELTPSSPLNDSDQVMQRHSFTALNSTFIVDSEYQFVKELGQGAYGCVVSAKHRRTGEGCAIKKITNINTKVRGPMH